MISGTAKNNSEERSWVTTALGFGFFLALAISMHGILLDVEYRWSKVLDVDIVAGQDATARMILIETPERMRLIRTSDPFIQVQKGAFICVSKRRMISRRWLRYRAALPGYCRRQPRPIPK